MKYTLGRLLIAALVAIAAPTRAQAPAVAPAGLSAITAQFQAAYDRDVTAVHAQSLLDLDAKYAAAVKRAFDAATAAAKLEEALELRKESQRLETKGLMPPMELDSLPPSLKQLRAAYRVALARLETDRAARAQPLFDHADKLLETLQNDLTSQSRFDEAALVKTKREELQQTLLALAPAIAPAADAPGAPATAAGAGASTAAPAPAGASQDSVIAWVLKYGGEAVLRANNTTVRVKDPKALPPAPFDLIELDVRAAVTDKEFAQVAAVPSLAAITLHGLTKITTLQPVAGLSSLRTFILGDTPLKDAEFAHLSGLANLQFLDLNLQEATGEGLSHLPGNAKLTEVHLKKGSLTPDSARAIAGLTSIKRLQLDSSVSRKNEKHLATFASLPDLETLAIVGGQLSAEGFAAIAGLKKLRTLDLRDSQFDNRGFAFLAPCAATLTFIDMQFQATISDEGIKHIVAALPNLETLSCSLGSTCTGDSLRELAKLTKLKKLSWWVPGFKDKDYRLLAALPAVEHLSLNSTAIGDDGLSAFPTSRTITYIDLANNAITDKGLAHLQATASLKSVNLSNTKVTAGGLAEFQKARPEVRVIK